jgi:hypothetical protein
MRRLAALSSVLVSLVASLPAHAAEGASEPIRIEDVPGDGAGPVTTRFFLGEAGEPIDGAAFYRAVGREDLADRYARRRAARTGLMWGGGIVALSAAVPVLYLGTSDCGEEPGFCKDESGLLLALAGGMALGGAVAFLVGWKLDPHPVYPTVRRDLARSHNQRLGAAPPVPDEAAEPDELRDAPAPAGAWLLVPTVGPSSAGLTLALTF